MQHAAIRARDFPHIVITIISDMYLGRRSDIFAFADLGEECWNVLPRRCFHPSPRARVLPSKSQRAFPSLSPLSSSSPLSLPDHSFLLASYALVVPPCPTSVGSFRASVAPLLRKLVGDETQREKLRVPRLLR